MTSGVEHPVAVNSIVEILRGRSAQTPDNRAYTFLSAGEESESLTFRQLDLRARALAARLQRLGAKGQPVLLLFPPGIEYISAFYACLTAGAVAVPAYPPRMNRNVHRLEAILEDARPAVVMTSDAVFRQLRSQLGASPKWAGLNWLIPQTVSDEEAEDWLDPSIENETVAFLQYTSASTAKPKGVIVSHGNILHNQVLMKKAVRHTSETIAVSWLPLFHDMGLISVVLASLYNGMPCHLMSPVDFLRRPRVWLEAITRYGATFSGAPDFGYQLCVDKISREDREGLDLSSWTVAYNGSEPVRADTLHRFAKAFEPFGFVPESFFSCYGLAEHTLFVTGGFYKGPVAFNRKSLEALSPHQSEDGASADLVSCGTPSPDVEVRLVESVTGRQCVEGQIGEIWLASPSVGQGYWNQPEATKRDFHETVAGDQKIFLRTGDLGFLHNGELFITGRLKDLIIIRGRNLVPHDIEQTVEQCDPAIPSSFVAAVSVEAAGAERLVVIAEVRREGRWRLDLAGLIERIRHAVAAEFAVEVSAVALLRPGTLPKTSSGKTQRAKVRQDFVSGNLVTLAQWRDETIFGSRPSGVLPAKGWGIQKAEDWIVQRLAEHVKVPATRIDRDLPISHYGLDSLVVAALATEIEDTFGIEWDIDQLFTGEPSARELARRFMLKRKQPARLALRINPTAVKTEFGGSVEPKPSSASGNGKPQVSSPAGLATQPAANSQIGPAAPSPNGYKPHKEHPFRKSVNPELAQLLASMGMDKVYLRGEGSWLWDDQGRRYLDFLAQYGALPFGFNPKRIWNALDAVRDSGEPSFVQPSYLNAAGELAKRLLAVAPPGMSNVTFANSGAEAVEAAIKLCRSATGRHDILAASNGFHGKTLGALSATDKEKYQKPFGAPVEGFHYTKYGDIEALRRSLSTRRYAGYLVEPVQAEGGIIEPPPGYLRAARKVCHEFGTLFVADEIQTGMGRTGAMFVCSALGITPDVITLAKALGGGLIPIGACLTTSAVYNADFGLKHTSTFAGNTLACRAGIATLDLLEENGRSLLKNVTQNGARLKQGLLDLKSRFPDLIADVRGRGYLLGVRFGLNRRTVDSGLLGYLGELDEFPFLVAGHLLNFEGVRVGCTLNQGGVMRIEPPLTATWDECAYFLRALERVLTLLERRDLATLTMQVSGFRQPAPSTAYRDHPGLPWTTPKRKPIEIDPDDGRFAFIVHPLAWSDYTNLDSTLSPLSDDQLATLSTAMADSFEPFVIGETRVVGLNGKAAYGEFILVPRRAEELKAMPRQEAAAEIHRAVRLGQSRGARIVGLGAYSSVVTEAGLSLKSPGMPALTTGNSYTVVAARETVRLAAAERGWDLSQRTVAVVGAGGAIGCALSTLLAVNVGRLILVGNPEHPEESYRRLLQVACRLAVSVPELSKMADFSKRSVAGRIAALDLQPPSRTDQAGLAAFGQQLIHQTDSVIVSTDAASVLPRADIVVCCTSSTKQFIEQNVLRSEAVVCDVSRPSNVSPDLSDQRPDVMVLNGGVVRLPENCLLGFNASLSPGQAYACMAETIMLAMEKRYHDISLGFDLPINRALEMQQLADELGFRIVLDKKQSSRQVLLPDHSNVMSEKTMRAFGA